MHRNKRQRLGLGLLAVAVLGLAIFSTPALAQTGGGLDLSWYDISSAGGTDSANGSTEAGQTVGQLAGPPMSGGDLVLYSGFWAAASDDCNTNGFDDDQEIVLGTSEDCNTNGKPDVCDPDADGEGDFEGDGSYLIDDCDNCPTVYNVDQANADGDDDGDVCDNCMTTPNSDQSDVDVDTVGDVCDNCVTTANTSQDDADLDTVGDSCDNCVDDANTDQSDIDADTVGDVCDPCPDYDDRIDCNGNGTADGCDINRDATSFDCDGNTVPDECQSGSWEGSNGGSFTDDNNWDPDGVPQIDAIIRNTTNLPNRVILDAGGLVELCYLTIDATGNGRQYLQINVGSTLAPSTGTTLGTRGTIDLRGGELAGGLVQNQSTSIIGYGTVSADVLNTGLIEGLPGVNVSLLMTGGTFENASGGTLRAAVGSVVLVQSGNVTQSGRLDIGATASITFDEPLTNLAGGVINIGGGALEAPFFTNDPTGLVTGFGTIECSIDNYGNFVSIADAQLVGDVLNEGFITIQNGLLTITGTLSGSGTIIGGFGGRDGGAPGSLAINGHFDVAVTDPAAFDLTHGTLQMAGDPALGAQTFEVMARDVGASNVTLPSADLFSLDTLHVGPTATTVQLVNARINTQDAGAYRRLAEATYVHNLVLDQGVTLDLAGQNLYYEQVSPADPFAAESGVMVIDSIGGGGLYRLTSATNDGSRPNKRTPR